jgi:hypothetical protein
MKYDLAGIGPDPFQRLCQALAMRSLGSRLKVFGAGPDGGRDASFDGPVPFPGDNPAGWWNGYGVVQVKHKSKLGDPRADLAWLRRQLEAELGAWADPASRRRQKGEPPRYLLLATNVQLSSVAGSGGKDKIDDLIHHYAEEIGLVEWIVWDGDQIATLLDTNQDLAHVFSLVHDDGRFPAVGRGVDGCEIAFQEAYDSAGGITTLGVPMSSVHAMGPGWVQDFRSLATGRHAVICALPERPAVAMAGSVWAALRAIGDPNHGGGLEGVGFPSPHSGHDHLDEAASRIRLLGGQWGPGWLTRTDEAGWRWRPKEQIDSNAFRDRDIRTGGPEKMDLRLRLSARIPCVSNGLRIDGAGRAQLEQALTAADTVGIVRVLGRPRHLDAAEPTWTRTKDQDGRNDSRGANYECSLNGTGGRSAIVGRLLFLLPTPLAPDLTSLVEVRVDFRALQPAPGSPTDAGEVPAELRITMPELLAFLAQSWRIAMNILPLALVDDPSALIPAGAPRVEMYVINERPPYGGGDRTLVTEQMLDLSPLGKSTRADLSNMAIAVTAPIDQTDRGIELTIKDAVAQMVEDFGFTEASRDKL